MGHPKFSRSRFDTPQHPWKKERIEEENEVRVKFSLKNMREIWKAKSPLRRHRQQAMKLIGRVDSEDGHFKREREDLLTSLQVKGLIAEDATLDDVLRMSLEDVLNRRLQSITYYKGLASSQKQARQLVSHGHISIDGQKITVPGYNVSRLEEDLIGYYSTSALNDENHKIRQMIEQIRVEGENTEEEVGELPEFTEEEIKEIKKAAESAPSADDVSEETEDPSQKEA